MLKIGEFSRLGQVTIKTLRYYDQLGLLKPVHIDLYTGYRYYDLSQLPTLNRILALKDLGFTLDEITLFIKQNLPNQSMVDLLNLKKSELRQKLADEQTRLLRVEARIKQILQEDDGLYQTIIIKSAPALLAVAQQLRLASISQLLQWQHEHLPVLVNQLNALGITVNGPAYAINRNQAFDEKENVLESGLIIDEVAKLPQTLQNMANFQVHILPAHESLASIVFSDDPAMLNRTYACLTGWVQANGYRAIAPARELVLKNDPDQLVMEIQLPVKKATSFYTQEELNQMQPKIVTRESTTMVGMRYQGKNEHNEIGDMWTKFNGIGHKIKHATGEAAIGLCTTLDDAPEGEFEYVAGFPVNKLEDVPEEMVIRTIPANTYAVFAHKGGFEGIGKTYEYAYQTWLPQSGFELADKIDFEYYDEDFKDFAPDSVFYIYLPIKPKL